MEKYFKRTSSLEIGSQNNSSTSSNKRRFLEFEVDNLIADPGQRPKISSYHPNDRDKVRCAYLQKGPCQPRTHDFPQTACGSSFRRFNPNWFDDYGNWLEYSISKDAVFCLCCYLMKPETEGGDAFVTTGFSNWKKKERLQIHVGIHDSAHNQAWRKCEALMRPKQHITAAIEKQSEQAKKNYQIHLTATIDCIRFLLRQGLAFRGNDETDDSVNQGNFLELLNFLAQHNEEIGRAFKNARGNLKLIAPSIQKDIVRAAARETTKVIVDDLGDELFAVLVDEARDISIKEQMSVCLRYVNKEGQVREHFLGLVHVSNTNALSLKLALESLLETYNLSLSRVRGQGYDGASNMQGEFNGLKTLILKENSYAFYVHCFAHQLQLALVTVAKKQVEIALLFNLLTNLCNVVGASCKRRDMLRDSQMTKTIEALKSGEIFSGRGLNQETALKRAGDTRWGSHYGTILRLISLFPSVVNVLEYVEEDGNNSEQRAEACHLLNVIQSFEFIFNLHLMKNILGVTNELSQALQRNDQDIVNAMALVKVSKQRLQNIRDDGCQLENFILDVRSDDQFSDLNGIGALSQKLVETRKNIVYPLVFLLLKLALVLPVATASVERTFSAMNIIKSRLRNRMGDEFLNDCLVTYIERETFDCIDNEKIIQSFQNMKPRRMEF
ncbi:uncharacterized protein [Arachis hypogaea]|uniref:uncharacterized protein n=1 Tax=Arachis hypogaea TaxID=3818 RepID=UPI00110573B0|nr:zinc finger MYM-type protein 1-like [Arachis hypogaea]